jgi:predicted kinase
MEVILMRGLPGSGKSSWIREQLDVLGDASSCVCSADDHHIIEGISAFKQENAAEAHRKCKRQYLDAMLQPKNGLPCERLDFLIVDNTNTTAWELAFFVDLASLFVVECKIVRMERDLRWCLAHNTHDVPIKTMQHMAWNLANEKLPPWWKEEVWVDGRILYK